MKKILTWLLIFGFVVTNWNIAITESNSIDFSSMTYQEMVELESRIEKVLLSTILLKDTTLPIGRYVAEDDIPAGSYVITAKSKYSSPRIYVKLFSSDNKEIESYELRPNSNCKVTLKEGMSMAVDESSDYDITVKIRSFNSFLTNSEITNSYVSKDDITENTGSVNPIGDNSAQPIGAEKAKNIYIYQHDKWNLYKATVLSDTVIKIDNWYRFIADEETPYVLDHNVMTISTIDGTSNFQWLDEEKNAFVVTMKDENSYQTQLKEPNLVSFTIVE